MLSVLIYLRLIVSILGLTFLLLNGQRTLYLPNSAPRYRLASYCRVLQYPALLWGPMGILVNSISGAAFWPLIPIDLLLTYVVTRRVKEFRADDDNDFWNKLGKKLKRKLKSFARKADEVLTPKPALQPIPLKY